MRAPSVPSTASNSGLIGPPGTPKNVSTPASISAATIRRDALTGATAGTLAGGASGRSVSSRSRSRTYEESALHVAAAGRGGRGAAPRRSSASSVARAPAAAPVAWSSGGGRASRWRRARRSVLRARAARGARPEAGRVVARRSLPGIGGRTSCLGHLSLESLGSLEHQRGRLATSERSRSTSARTPRRRGPSPTGTRITTAARRARAGDRGDESACSRAHGPELDRVTCWSRHRWAALRGQRLCVDDSGPGPT